MNWATRQREITWRVSIARLAFLVVAFLIVNLYGEWVGDRPWRGVLSLAALLAVWAIVHGVRWVMER